MLKSNISNVYSDKYMKMKTNSDDNLPLEKTLNMQNAVVLIKSAFHENYNHYYY